MRLLVGLTALVGRIERYAENFDLLELRLEPGRSPGDKALGRLRAAAPRDLEFSVLLPPLAAAVALEAGQGSVSGVDAARRLEASFVVLQTGPEVGPSARVRGRLAALVGRLADAGAARRGVAWEPRGPWELEAAAELAQELGIVLVEDLTRHGPPSRALSYTRLRNLGAAGPLRPSALERLAERLELADEAYVVLEGPGSPKARARVRAALGLGDGASFDEDEADDEDGEIDQDAPDESLVERSAEGGRRDHEDDD